ncbi:MAG: DUF4190 domain-containing protein [Butyrivibrio sp.]|nr:DUF4190 domain-containing protein [Butyrivibrio sp.]
MNENRDRNSWSFDDRDERYYYNNYNYNKAHNQLDPRVVMATAAMVTGLVSIALSFTVYISVVIGGIAILTACLTREGNKRLLPQARRGLICGIIGVGLSYFLLIHSITAILTDPGTRAYMNRYSEQLTGESFDQMLQEIEEQYGVDLSDYGILTAD